MSESKRFDQEQLRGARFHGCGLAQAEFEDVDLADSRRRNVNFRGGPDKTSEQAKLTDVNCHSASDNANIRPTVRLELAADRRSREKVHY